MENFEERISKLEFMVLEHLKFETFLFSLVLRQNNEARLEYAECLRKMLLHPVDGQPISPYLRSLLQAVRDSLLSEADPKLAAIFSSLHIRPVE